MAELNLHKMAYQLACGGVAPKYIKRTLSELNSHLKDLKNQALGEGFSPAEANEKALAAIGDEKTLVQEILGKRELKSWLWRFPKLSFILLPVLIIIVSIFLFGVCLYLLANYFPELFEMSAGTIIPIWARAFIEIWSMLNFQLLAPLVGVGMILLAKQRLIPLRWPIIGMVLVLFIGSGWGYEIYWPTATTEGSLNMSWGYSFLPRGFRDGHDLQNYLNMLATISLSAITAWLYRPHSIIKEKIIE